MKMIFAVAGVLALLVCGAGSAVAQGRGRQAVPPVAGGAGAEDATGVTPGEVQKMFDAYALMQAQEQLKIGDEQFTKFLTRFKALQESRRSALQERVRIINTLRRMINQQADEGQLKERMSALQELDTKTAGEVKKAYDAIDQILDVKQQAQFRVFEELMERRKLELVVRARQANRSKP